MAQINLTLFEININIISINIISNRVKVKKVTFLHRTQTVRKLFESLGDFLENTINFWEIWKKGREICTFRLLKSFCKVFIKIRTRSNPLKIWKIFRPSL